MTGISIVGAADLVGDETVGQSVDQLMVTATMLALDEAGLDLQSVDGVFCATPNDNMPTLRLAETLGIRPRFFDGTSVGGGSYESFLGHAALALQAGLCDVALLAYASTQKSSRGGFQTRSTPPAWEYPYGLSYPSSSFALIANRHMHQYGTTSEQLAATAVAARDWARLNPRAARREPLSVADVLASPMISSPLHKLDCCLVTDGAGAIVLTRSDRAADLAATPVHVLGHGEAFTHRYISAMDDLTRSAAAQSGPRALQMAGLQIRDIDVFQLYDAFTISVLITLEDLGVCARGESGALVESGATSPGGSIPLNTSGGGLSYCHPGMFGIFLLVEAVRQLRGEAGDRQVNNATTALVHGLGGVLSSGSTAVLSTRTP